VETVQILLKHHADTSVTDEDGLTATAHAQQKGYDGILNLLKEG
jgi:hypothetical protein